MATRLQQVAQERNWYKGQLSSIQSMLRKAHLQYDKGIITASEYQLLTQSLANVQQVLEDFHHNNKELGLCQKSKQ